MHYLVLGSGRFGRIAVERLMKKDGEARLTVVDQDSRALEALGPGVEAVNRPGLNFLIEYLDRMNPDWIVPAVPVHAAFLWVEAAAGRDRAVHRIPVPGAVETQVPHPLRGEGGTLYASFADFICPDDCPEPKDRCFKTGLKRQGNLYDVFEAVSVKGFVPVVVRSRQLAPGVGGFTPEALKSALDRVLQASSAVLFGTACRCHGVLNGLAVEK